MPAYNASLYITEAIESLLNQTFRDFELWVIDDGSTDTTYETISKLTDSRLRLHRNATNRGREETVNDYVDKVQTPFFTVTDADDVSHPRRLEKQLACLIADPEILMCGTSYVAMDIRGECFRKVRLPSHQEEILRKLYTHAQFHGPTTVMRRGVLERIKPFYRKDCFESDADLCCRILNQGKTANVDELLYYYRIVPNSMSSRNVDPLFLNSYKVVLWLYEQRVKVGNDMLEQGNHSEIEAYRKKILADYSTVSYLHQRAFTDIYWNLRASSLRWSWRAVKSKPTYIKSYFVLGVVCSQCIFSLVKSVFLSKHYRKQLLG